MEYLKGKEEKKEKEIQEEIVRSIIECKNVLVFAKKIFLYYPFSILILFSCNIMSAK